ncbi:Amidase [Ostertagia ostertagi]
MLLLVALILGAAYLFHLYSKRQQRQKELHHVVAKREYERAESIAVAEVSCAKLNPATRNKIAAWDFVELKGNRGQWVAVGKIFKKAKCHVWRVLRTYQYKALRAHAETNSVTLFIKEAERWAAEWDEKATAPNFTKPRLEGYDTTRGFVQDVGKPSKSDSVLIQQIKQFRFHSLCQQTSRSRCWPTAVAILFTALQTHLWTDREPLVVPQEEKRRSLAADGSIIGIGGDVGGSIRIPCHFTGMAGIKPSHLRFSHRGNQGAVPGRPLINANEGPMGRDILTSVEFLKEVWSDNWITENDPYVPPVVWNDEMYRKGNKYRIGYYVDDGWFTPVPAIQRAVLEAKAHLEAAELRETYAEIEQYRGDVVELMLKNHIDALLCPPQVLITPKHNVPAKLFSAVAYTALFNLLDFGAGVVNVTKVNESDEQKLRDEYPETDLWYRTAKEACKDSVGYPVNVQVAAPPYREEIVLRLLRDIEIAVTGK